VKYPREQIKHIHRSDCLNFERFDKDYNVDTASPVIQADDNPEELRPWWEDNSDLLPGSEGYQPVPLYWVDMMILYFSDKNLKDMCLVDVGAGKGKVILHSLFKNAPFDRYIGIEADPKYADIFKKNLETTNINVNKPVLPLVIDAMDFDYSSNNMVYFFFQPFSIELFTTFVNTHIETLRKTNSYFVCVMGEHYNLQEILGMTPLFTEGLLSIYRFGDN
jgi:tRNA G46 methylase TrmB